MNAKTEQTQQQAWQLCVKIILLSNTHATCYTEYCKDFYNFYGLQNYSSRRPFTLSIGATGKRWS